MDHKRQPAKTGTNTAGHFIVNKSSYKRGGFFRDPEKDEPDSQWEGFKDTLKKIAAVPKEEVDELRAKQEQEKKRAR